MDEKIFDFYNTEIGEFIKINSIEFHNDDMEPRFSWEAPLEYKWNSKDKEFYNKEGKKWIPKNISMKLDR